ncbi:MAG: sensor histidine kinase [Eubacterium sp.]|nr:sensor histidine kinase [Eubacterium sp.]
MKLFWRYLKYRRKTLALCAFLALLLALSFFWYHLPFGAICYPVVLCFVIGSSCLILDFFRVRRKHQQLLTLKGYGRELEDGLPVPHNIPEEDYQELMIAFCEEQRKSESDIISKYNDMIDYYTTWAHQIKTPIAAIRLNLQNEDSAMARNALNDLSRVEQYVEMVLTFLRLDSSSTDYLLREYELDEIVRPAVKKFAGEFIARKLKLLYTPLCTKVLTDEKWLSFVIEQILSNALKYTDAGSIAIYLEEPKILCIRDTGMGIAPEDLPRIFEKGYTGFNGRMDKKASGIGLYLCKRICTNLGHGLSAESEIGKGTVIRIHLNTRKIEID